MNSSREFDITPRYKEYVDLQTKICRALATKAFGQLTDLPSDIIEDVRLHIITCPEKHQNIPGLDTF